MRKGILRFAVKNTTNPVGSADYGLYVNGSGSLIFSSAGTSTTLGATGGSGSIASFEALYNNDQTMAIAAATFTIDRSAGNGDVLTLTNTGAGTGDTLQITNVGTGKDINGTSGTWSFSKTGQGVAKDLTIAGTAGSDSITLTAGDVQITDGSVNVVDADNAFSLKVTNDTATTASVFVFAGSGAFTGSTTTSFFTITPSGLTTGTAVYLPVAGLTTGRAIHVVADAVTSGIVVNVTSSATAITGAGRLFLSTHSGVSSTSGILNEFISAAADETVIVKISATAALALGTALAVSVSAVTTGNGITLANLDSLTDGYGLQIASSATAISSTGKLLLVNHTGVTTAAGAGILAQFTTAATDATTVIGVTLSSAVTTVGVKIADAGTGMTSGSLLRITTASTAAVATNGIVSITASAAYTSTSNTGLLNVVANSITTGATVVNISMTAATTSVGLRVISSGTGLTSGSLALFSSGTTGAIATNGAVSIVATGAYTSTSNAGFVNITANSTTGGTVLAVNATGLTDGVGIYSPSAEAGLTTGKYLSLGGVFTVAKFGATVIAGSALGTAALTLTAGDIVVTSGDIVLTAGGITSALPTGRGIGYATGAGGTVTQITNRSTGVTLNTLCGKIQTDTTSLAAGASAEFTLTNSTIAIGDVVVVSQRSGSSNVAGVAGVTVVEVVTVAAGSCIISVNNQSTTTAETGAIVINFAVIKAVTA